MIEDVFTLIGVATVGLVMVILPEIRLCMVEHKMRCLKAEVEDLQSQINGNTEGVTRESQRAESS